MRHTCLVMIVMMGLLAGNGKTWGDSSDVVSYVGGMGSQQLSSVLVLSDGSALIGGSTTSLDFVPDGVPRYELGCKEVNSTESGRYGFILHVSADLNRVLHCVYLPKGVTTDVRRMRATNMPGQTTGEIYISAPRVNGNMEKAGGALGYFIAKLDHNFLDRPATKFEWVYNVPAVGEFVAQQPWDVDSHGRVYLAAGEPFGKTWGAIYRLKTTGQYDVVEHWRFHNTSAGPWSGEPASSNTNVEYSAISLKAMGRGSLRSWTMADHTAYSSDGNGGKRQGTYPLDLFFSGPFDPKAIVTSSAGPGYTGYAIGPNNTMGIGGICVDRRNNHLYFGLNIQSKHPKEQLDTEPAVIAMDNEGRLKWWNRLYAETQERSKPQQLVSVLEIDYSQSPESGSVVVMARCYGDAPANFWRGDQLRYPQAPKRSFQSFFDGVNRNIWIAWLGRLSLADGTVRNATYVGEYAEGLKIVPGNNIYPDPNLDGWPDHDANLADLAETRLRADIQIDAQGRVGVLGAGRRVITTAHAYQKMPKPEEGVSTWSEFVRIYNADFTTLTYSSLLTGKWNKTTGEGGNNTALTAFGFTPKGVLVVGFHTIDRDGIVEGKAITVQNVPTWARPEPAGEEGILAQLHYLTENNK